MDTEKRGKRRIEDTLAIIARDRERTNILRGPEQRALAWLVCRVPAWLNSDALTAIGLGGSMVVMLSFILARYFGVGFLWLGVLGFIINWLGDSLDGRVAYYRNKPRKWYGFSLDICTDWLSVICIGIGNTVYVDNEWELYGFGFVVLYGWSMMMALIRYKITHSYTIDSGLLGPTEVRIIISLILILEVFVKGSIPYSAVVMCVVLLITNIRDFFILLRLAEIKDSETDGKTT